MDLGRAVDHHEDAPVAARKRATGLLEPPPEVLSARCGPPKLRDLVRDWLMGMPERPA
jgi:hypothetical protein